MNYKFTIHWQPSLSFAALFTIGDVRPILISAANEIFNFPPIEFGLGAFTDSLPQNVGEGAVIQKNILLTPPTPEAGVETRHYKDLAKIRTPFCVGWSGEAVASGFLRSNNSIKLRELYRHILEETLIRSKRSSLILMAAICEFETGKIFDRALKKPVDKGNVPITSQDHQDQYFRSQIINGDLPKHGISPNTFPLSIVGMIYSPSEIESAWLKNFERSVFYTPPGMDGFQFNMETNEFKTHFHAIGWRDDAILKEQLDYLASQDDNRQLNEVWDHSFQRSHPDYIVHLDEWSELTNSRFQIYLPDTD